jgi:hypothetical protein
MVALLGISCAGPRQGERPASQPATQPATTTDVPQREWLGVYASTSETGGFAGTVLVLEKGALDGISYRMRSYTDVRTVGEIRQDEQRGGCLTEGNALYLPEAYGYMDDGKPRLLASIERYTLVEINGRKVLMREDALHAFRTQNKLYDYGILVKVKDEAELWLDLKEVEHPSIKLLYSDPTRSWKDPFVHGPNSR